MGNWLWGLYSGMSYSYWALAAFSSFYAISGHPPPAVDKGPMVYAAIAMVLRLWRDNYVSAWNRIPPHPHSP